MLVWRGFRKDIYILTLNTNTAIEKLNCIWEFLNNNVWSIQLDLFIKSNLQLTSHAQDNKKHS